jgi:hypothetical protein
LVDISFSSVGRAIAYRAFLLQKQLPLFTHVFFIFKIGNKFYLLICPTKRIFNINKHDYHIKNYTFVCCSKLNFNVFVYQIRQERKKMIVLQSLTSEGDLLPIIWTCQHIQVNQVVLKYLKLWYPSIISMILMSNNESQYNMLQRRILSYFWCVDWLFNLLTCFNSTLTEINGPVRFQDLVSSKYTYIM